MQNITIVAWDVTQDTGSLLQDTEYHNFQVQNGPQEDIDANIIGLIFFSQIWL